MSKRTMKRSVALAYDQTLPAPIVVAKGTGMAAARIDAIAAQNGVPVVSDPVLVAGLEPLDVGAFVPVEYWELVARVLIFIRNVRQ